MTDNNKPYSNLKATLAIAKAAFRSITRSPSAVVFSLAFPLIFILVFGFIGGGGVSVDVGVAPNSDTSNVIYKALAKMPIVKLYTDLKEDDLNGNLSKGSLDAVIDIKVQNKGWQVTPAITDTNLLSKSPFVVNVQYTNASSKGSIVKSVLTNILTEVNTATYKRITGNPQLLTYAEVKETTIKGRAYKTIDFILPGQLGFSLLSTGVFGTAFVFLSLRVTLVIKRFFATPVQRYSIVLGEAIARISFSLIGALFIILVGHFAFGFTLIHGAVTVVNMLLLSILGIIVFMGFGFVVSSIAKNESSVPPIANIITLPQFLLSGTFFSITAFPTWLQPISRALPLTYLNDALRKVAFEGAGLFDVGHQILIMLIWGVVVYGVAVKTFKWE
ncbi:ABC transporter permease [Mucilaginibacter auburnensis]|uniref:Transport permease protein n=1 Tax=Mucilaginibacter auburnensis TaxID=1457233 RepID=A0A2H9VN08_9SPHI|nr:ABC transporter permease [Mucilaginibacter auburnensis]PJJ79706.1 ABC-2 type transport system permease protein [Mucilaginibacter auburnensis]